MAESGGECRQTGSSSRALQESTLHSIAHPLLSVISCGPSRVSMLQLLFHSVAGHGALEVRLLEPLAVGDQVGSSEAGWM